MNGRAIVIGTCVVGSLVGLGFLTHYVYGGSKAKAEPELEEDSVPTEPVETPVKEKADSYQKPAKKKAAPKKRAKTMSKPEVKKTMAEKKVLAPPVADEFPLRLGSKGDRVERLQVWLMRNYGWTGKITGEFDEKTEALLKRFFKKEHLDEATYEKMKMGKPVYEQTLMR